MTKFLLFTFLMILILNPFSISINGLTSRQDENKNICYNKAQKSARSTTIFLINDSGTDLFYITSRLDHGIWTADCDPSATSIVPNRHNVSLLTNQMDLLLALKVQCTVTPP
ncbi:hypothetical protein RCL_jg15532.t1 [Rhizophagus clarus]|uniref:Uncharacterized protein n=1 Tax=Rhizophagus clarus TaxID=94130 RepID=A0A8H3KRP4_9GLOM|nr:hypothetical protein RCL_jg15532.t1 [Rhizophagus clarus]